MDGYPRFLHLTLQRWERFVIVQNVSPIVNINKLEAYFSKFGEIERIWFIHNPENGCFMKKALILMKSPRSAADIIDKRYHRFGTDAIPSLDTAIEEIVAIPSLDTAIEEIVTTVKYRGRVKMYTHGLYDLHLKLKLPWNQNSEDDRTLMGLYLTRLIVRAYRGLIFTSIRLKTDADYMYTGQAIVSFQYKCDKEIVLKRTKEQLKVRGMWVDPELDDTWDDEVAEGASEKVEGDEDGDVLDVEGDEDGDVLDVEGDEDGSDIRMRKVQTIRMRKVRSSDNSDTWDDEVAEGASEKIEGDEEGDVESSVNWDEDTGAEGDVEDDEEGSVNWDEDW